MNLAKHVDIVYLSILSLSIIFSLYYHFFEGYVLSINNYVAILLLVFVITRKILKSDKIIYGVLILLILSTLNIINFSFFTINAAVYHIGDNLIINGLGFNIIAFLLLIIYIFINRKISNQFFRKVFRKSEEEEIVESAKMNTFYYNKFYLLDSIELNQMMKNVNDYPIEAQNALKKVKAERNGK